MLNSRFYYCWGLILQKWPPQYLPCGIHLLAIKLSHSSQLDWGLHSLPWYLSRLLTGAEVMSLSRRVVKDYTAPKFNIVLLESWLLEHSLHDTRKLKDHMEGSCGEAQHTLHSKPMSEPLASVWWSSPHVYEQQPPGDFTLPLASYPQPFSHPVMFQG